MVVLWRKASARFAHQYRCFANNSPLQLLYCSLFTGLLQIFRKG